jgi:hypothetical protein
MLIKFTLFSFKYVNGTQKRIKIDDYRDGNVKSHNLTAGSSLIGRVDLFNGAEIDVFSFTNSDSLVLTYDNNIKVKWTGENNSIRNPLILNNYDVISEPDKDDEYLFTFLASDLSKRVKSVISLTCIYTIKL